MLKNILSICAILIVFGHQFSFAHTPHDVIDAIDVTGNAAEGYSVYIVMGHYRILRSDNLGRSWKQLIRGLDNRYPYTDIAVAPDSQKYRTLFVTTAGDGIYKSVDGGDSWYRTNKGLPTLSLGNIAVSPGYLSDRTVLATGISGGLFITQNGGDSWSQILGVRFRITAIEFAREQTRRIIYVGDEIGRLYRSGDSGQSWHEVSHIQDAGRITCIAASPEFKKDGTLLIGTENKGVLRSTDKEKRFEPSNAGLPEESVQSIVFSPDYADDSTIYASCWHQAGFRSTNGGRSWRKHRHGLTTNDQADRNPLFFSPQFRDIKILKNSVKPHTILLAGFDGLFESGDSGRSWTQIETEAAGWILSVSTSPPIGNDFQIAMTTHNAGVYLANNTELFWSVLNRGLKKPRCGRIEFSPGYAQDKTLFSFIDEGDHFIRLRPENHGWQSVRLKHKPHLNWKSRILNYLKRKGLPESVTTDFLSKEEKKKLIRPKGQAHPKRIALSPNLSKDRSIYIATRKRGLFKSIDGGKTVLPLTPIPIESWSIVMSPEFPADQTLFISSRLNGIKKSDDGGQHWRSINTGLSFLDEWKVLSKQNGRQGIELGRSQFYNIYLAISPHFGSDNTLFAFGGFGLYKSINAGESWAQIRNNTLDHRAQVLSLCISPDFDRDQTVYISVKGRGLFKSLDGGRTFIALNDRLLKENHLIRHLELSPFYPQDRTLFAASEEALFRSQDRGNTWHKIDRMIRYENNYRQGVIEYSGDWELIKDKKFSSGNASLSQTKGSKVVFKFFGSGVKWVASPDFSRKSARIFIDELAVDSARERSGKHFGNDILYAVRNLIRGPHTLKIEVLEPLELDSKTPGVLIDAFDVLDNP